MWQKDKCFCSINVNYVFLFFCIFINTEPTFVEKLLNAKVGHVFTPAPERSIHGSS